jgi:hypothetical protein
MLHHAILRRAQPASALHGLDQPTRVFHHSQKLFAHFVGEVVSINRRLGMNATTAPVKRAPHTSDQPRNASPLDPTLTQNRPQTGFFEVSERRDVLRVAEGAGSNGTLFRLALMVLVLSQVSCLSASEQPTPTSDEPLCYIEDLPVNVAVLQR